MITPRLDSELVDELRELARLNRRTLNATVELILERGLQEAWGGDR